MVTPLLVSKGHERIDMSGRAFEMLPDAVELEEVDVSERADSLEEGPRSPHSVSSQYGDCCSAVDLTHPSSKIKSDDTETSKLQDSLELIKQGSALSNSLSPQSFTPSLEAFMGNPHLMQALAAFAVIGGAESRGSARIADVLPTSIKDGSQSIAQKAATAPAGRSSEESGTQLAEDGAKQLPGNMKTDTNGKVEMLYCSFCDYSCTLKCTLNVHMMKHDSSKQFTCSECSYTTSRSSDLKKHVRIHTGEKPFKCELCDYKSTEQGALRKHMLTHNCDNPHCCPLCDYVSPRIGDLKRHMHIHSDKKPHACQHCDYKASQLPRLRKHMLIHTGQKPYVCTYCDYRCREPRNLKTHIQTHTGEKPYSCPHCQYKSGRLGTLRRHITSIHPPDDSSESPLPRHFLESGDDQDEQVQQSVREVS